MSKTSLLPLDTHSPVDCTASPAEFTLQMKMVIRREQWQVLALKSPRGVRSGKRSQWTFPLPRLLMFAQSNMKKHGENSAVQGLGYHMGKGSLGLLSHPPKYLLPQQRMGQVMGCSSFL